MRSISLNVSDWRKRVKEKLFYILGGKCFICGYDKCPEACDFHHLDKALKNFTVAQALANGTSIEKILREVQNCVLLCANCHREVHAGLHSEMNLISSFMVERYEEVFKDNLCLECQKPLYNIKHNFCSKTCNGRYFRKRQKRIKIEKDFWKDIDVVVLLSKNDGIISKAAKEIGLSDNAVKKRFKKITGCRNWEEYILSLPK